MLHLPHTGRCGVSALCLHWAAGRLAPAGSRPACVAPWRHAGERGTCVVSDSEAYEISHSSFLGPLRG